MQEYTCGPSRYTNESFSFRAERDCAFITGSISIDFFRARARADDDNNNDDDGDDDGNDDDIL